jgi:phosphate transport system substrate-binding protein
MMRSILLVLLVGLIPALTAYASDDSTPALLNNKNELSGKLVITGSSTVAPLVSEIAKRFEAQHSDVRIDIQMGGSSRGISDVREGISNIGMASRSLKENEEDLFAFPIALDGVSIIVHKDNPVAGLTDEQIINIYTGKITNWKEIGGKDAPITVVNKAEGRATLEVFLNHFHLKNSDIKPHVVIGDNEQGVKTVAGRQNAIGYVSIGTAEYDSTIGIPIKLLPLNGISASVENIRNGTFPIYRPLNLVTKTPPEGLTKTFIDYAGSSEVADIVEGQYFVTLSK